MELFSPPVRSPCCFSSPPTHTACCHQSYAYALRTITPVPSDKYT